ncbi:MAG: carboxypeptidase regulatory-like domain-containing protein [Acidobacteria bacterium]|nr:carboxypeptidase regulatory-like domain-containing protein [Acidobacteriota bacterium]
MTVGYGQRSEKPKREPPKAEKIEEAGKGTLNGVVRDSVGAVIPGVRLELFQEGVKKPRKTKSDADGNFEFAKVPAGIFVIKAHLQSFKKTRVENIILKDQQTTTVNVVMEPGEISVTVGMADYLE